MPTTLFDKGKVVNLVLVEDDDVDARAITRAFKKARVENPIHRAKDGVDALELLRGENGKEAPLGPRILLVDLNMPRMNGIQLVEALRADPALSQSIVFILTTSTLDEDKAAAYELNVAGYVTKERAGEEFLNLIGLLDAYWRIVEMPAA